MKKNILIAIIVICSLFSLYFYSLSKIKEDTIYFISGYHKSLFGSDGHGFFNLATIIEKSGYKVIETNSFKNLKNAKYFVVFDIHKSKFRKIKRLPQKKLILFVWEPPTTIKENHDKSFYRYFSKIFTFNDALIDNKKLFKFYYPDAKKMIEDTPSFENKKFCTQITSDKSSDHPCELYTERRNAIKYFEEFAPSDFDLYGIGWKKEEFSSYKGSIPDKIKTLSEYKFAICYENSKDVKGYISEKIFDCFHTGTIPIYLGADNITDYIPDNCFIDKRKFKSYNELYVYLKTMSEDDYQTYLDNINLFLKSEKAKLFTGDNLIETFKKALELEK
ncbi:MAG: hypothetical protein K940chlam1_00615 [Candidatus Anoxychlamydiales bacterium]|nr:hypothetical protein [Candidatus Anoxychlamydiales bacterium]NGX35720.1 hypothetical protein [Candidatus Anoxychlamydiales bacterium]